MSGPRWVDGEPEHEGSADAIELTIDQADAIWRWVERAHWRRAESCAEGEGTLWSVEVEADGDYLTSRCRGGLPARWSATLEALDEALERDHAEHANDELFWPFGGTYWQDELRYYGAAS